MIKIESFVEEIELQYFFNRHDIDKAITELKKEGRLPEQYKTNYDNIIKILNREIANEETLRHMMRQMPDVILCDTDKRKEDIRKAIKDIIASSFDIRQF